MRTIEYHVQWAAPSTVSPIGEADWTTVNADAATEGGAMSIKNDCIREWPHQSWRVCLVVLDLIPLPSSVYVPKINPVLSPFIKRDHDLSTQAGDIGFDIG